jgi:hypothetical protein
MKDDNTSAPRTTVYVFGATVLALIAYYVDAEVDEIALWQAVLGASIPFGGLVLATVKAWPKKPKDDADA